MSGYRGTPRAGAGTTAAADLDETALRAMLNGAYEDAANYADEILAPEREKAFDYFLGEVYGRTGEPEKPEDVQGRTSIVVREVADIIQAMLPGLVRIFAGGEEAVRYEPQGPEDEAVAEQQTDYVNYLLNADGNNWFVTLHDALHDALLKKNGILQWTWDERQTVDEFSYSGLSPFQAQMLRDDPDCEILYEESTPIDIPPSPMASVGLPGAAPAPSLSPGNGAAPTLPASPLPPGPPSGPGAAVPLPLAIPAGGGGAVGAPPGAMPGAAGGAPPGAPPIPPPAPFAPPMLPPVTIDLTVRRTTTKRALKVEAVPPEEFLIDRAARSIQTSGYCARRTTPTVSELVALGYDRDAVEKHASSDFQLLSASNRDGFTEAEQRNPGLSVGSSRDGLADKSLWRCLHVEHFIRYDSDDDGISELHRVCTVGEGADLIHYDEIVPEAPFATGSPVRMPHAVIGLSVADQVSDLQDLKTNVLRSTLDSLAQSIFPDMAVVENAVEMSDFLSSDVGRVLRMKAPGMAQPLAQPFIGQQSLAIMQYLDEVRTQRTGITRASTGLDDKVLQSTTKTAVDNTVEKAQERVELIARTVAETLIKDAFGGILRCIVRHQDKPRTVRLRNRWVEVDPRFWNSDADVTVNVGLGRGTDQMRLTFLGVIAQKQQEILTATGPGNPLVAPSQYRETLAEMTRISGYKDASRFWKPITREDDQKIIDTAAKSQQAQQQRDPAMILAQVEKMKADTEANTKKEEQRLRFITAQAEDDRERDKAIMEFMIKAAEVSAKYGAQIDMANLRALVDRERSAFQNANDVQLQAQQQALQQATEQQRMQQEGGLAQQRLDQDGELGREKILSAENVALFKAKQMANRPGGGAG